MRTALGLIALGLATICPIDANDTLKGLKAVSVVVETLNEPVKQLGFTEEELKQDVELKLRQNSLKVSSENRVPFLYLNVNCMRVERIDAFVYNVQLSVVQNALVISNGEHAAVDTWESSYLGIISANLVRNAVRESVKDRLDRFLNAYLKANPR